MIYAGVVVALLMLFFSIVGKAIVQFTRLESVKHASVYGAIFYVTVFFIISFFFIILGLSWHDFFIVELLFTLITLFWSIFILIKNRSEKLPTMKTCIINVMKYVQDNWLVLAIILLFTFLNFASKTTEFLNLNAYGELSIATDEHFYIAKAAKFIGAENLNFSHFTPVFGGPIGLDVQMLNAYYELFWSFISQFFHLSLLTVSHTVLVVCVYFFIFFAYDEMIYLFAKKRYPIFKYSLLFFVLLHCIVGMQFENLKLMFTPWFGNVMTTFGIIPISLIVVHHALKNKVMASLLVVLPFIFVGFNMGGVVSVLYVYPIVIFFWLRNTQITGMYKKIVTVLLSLTYALFVILSLVQAYIVYGSVFPPVSELVAKAESQEYFLLKDALHARLFFMLPGILFYFYRLSRKKLTRFEKYFVTYFYSWIVVLRLPLVGAVLSSYLQFGLRRIAEGSFIILMMYSVIALLVIFQAKTFKKIMLVLFVALYIVYINNGSFLKTSLFSKQPITNPERLPQLSKQIYDYLSQDQEVRHICAEPNLNMPVEEYAPEDPRTTKETFVDLKVPILADSESYIATCDSFYSPGAPEYGYFLVGSDDEQAKLTYHLEDKDIVATFVNDEKTMNLYKVKSKNITD